MEYFDMHAHHKCFGIENIDYPAKTPDRWFSVGVHPWYLTFENKKDYINYVLANSENTYCKAIGECGLDKICNTDFELQKDVFVEMIDISEKKKKPLIIHCVKAFNEIIELHKKLKPAQKWIIHGFRGKPELAKILTDIGIMLSFGEY